MTIFFLQNLTLYYLYFYQIPLKHVKPQPRVLFLSKNELIILKCVPFYRPYQQETTWNQAQRKYVT